MMTKKLKSDSTPLYAKAKDVIIGLILQGAFPADKLPSEEALFDMLGVSRPTVREALAAMHREGIITKLHGTGNIIHKKSLKARMRIDKFSNFHDLLEDGGYTTRLERTAIRWIDDPETWGVQVSDDADSRYLLIEHVHYADEKPAILARNCIRESVLSLAPEELEGHAGTFGDLLNRGSLEKAANSIIAFKPAAADATESAKLDIPVGTPLIRWSEQFHSVSDTVLCYSRVSFHPTLVNMTLLRRWL
jgi:GntR family transcriptional regulator